jgi:hypothetical protein
MLKIHRKPWLVVGLLLCIAGVSLAAYAYIWISSNVVSVDVQYSVNLETISVVDSGITLNATVTNNGLKVRPGLVVDFYYAVDGGDWISFATQLTDDGGVAQAIYNATYNGRYDFKAGVNIP